MMEQHIEIMIKIRCKDIHRTLEVVLEELKRISHEVHCVPESEMIIEVISHPSNEK